MFLFFRFLDYLMIVFIKILKLRYEAGNNLYALPTNMSGK